MAAQGFGSVPLTIAGALTAVTASTTETGLHQSIVVPAGYLFQGKTYRLAGAGNYSTTANANLTLGVRFGTNGTGGTVASDTLLASTQTAASPTATTQLFLFDILLNVYKLNAAAALTTTADFQCNGQLRLYTGVAAVADWAIAQAGTNPAAVTAVAVQAAAEGNNFLTVTAKWGTNNASTIQLLNATFQELN